MAGGERRLAAILSADAVAYSLHMAEDEAATIHTIQGHRDVMSEAIRSHDGRVVDATGDNLLAEFPSALQAMEAGIAVQRALADRNRQLAPEHRMLVRLGIHAGDVRIEDGRLYGDAVNLAARLEPLAPPGGLCISGDVYRQVHRRLALPFEDIGEQQLKNISDPVRAYRLVLDPETAEPAEPEPQGARGYLDDFEHDVFINYAPIDDRPDREGERGWVESFGRALQLRLLKRFGRDVGVWRPELSRSDGADPTIERAVKSSAVMISLISKSYLGSESCHQELEWFAAQAAEQRAGLAIDDQVRIVPVLLYNVPRDEWPEALGGTPGFSFHEAEEQSFGRPLRPDRDKFEDQLCALVEQVHEVLTTIAGRGTAASAEEPAQDRTVFLAEVSDDLRGMRRDLRYRLEENGIEIVKAIPPPEEASRHETAVVDALGRSRLSVHLLGALPGRPIDEDQPALTYTTEQMRIGLERSRSQLVVMPTGLEARDIAEPEYADLITTLNDQQREVEQLEIIRSTGRAQLVQEVLTKLERIESQKQEALRATGDVFGGSAFVDLHVNDLPYAGDLVGHLHQRHFAPITIPSGDLDPKAGMSIFEEHLHKSQLFIVVFGRVARDWVEHRLNEAFKLILSNRLSTRVGVYVAPPHKSADDLSFPPFFCVMDNSGEFDPATVDQLLVAPTVGG